MSHLLRLAREEALTAERSRKTCYFVHPAFSVPVPAEGRFRFDVEERDLPGEWSLLSDHDQIEALRRSWRAVSRWAAVGGGSLMVSEYPRSHRNMLERLGLRPDHPLETARSDRLVRGWNEPTAEIVHMLEALFEVPYLCLVIIRDSGPRVEVRDLSWDAVYVWADRIGLESLSNAIRP
jgi:hypothetical protein